MQHPRVSVILPVYNGETYIKNSLESILIQSYKNFELIIGDDGSKDNTLKIIESYKDNRIKLFKHNVNQGLFKNLNHLIAEAESEYIRLWAQDDIMKPECLEEEIEFHQQHPEVGMSYCQRDIIDEHNQVLSPALKDNTPEIVSSNLANQISFYHGSMPGNIATVMLKKSVLDNVGLFREDMRVSGDFEMWVRIMEHYPIGYIHKSLIKLRSHPNQFSRRRGIYLAFIQEDREIFTTLIKRLPPDILDHARQYMRWHHYTQYVHSMFRSFLAGDLETAVKIFQEISKFESILVITCLWLITGNKRWWVKKPKYLLN
jgi:glycosyltransferase involved in cell wall biosynthesis